VVVAISSGTAEAALRFPDGRSTILLERVEGTFVASVGVHRGFTIWGIEDAVSPALEFSLPERYSGQAVRFRVCWKNIRRKTACVSRTRILFGTDTGAVIANIYLRPKYLPRWTTFAWFFEGERVARISAYVKV
jgi:hypothetical protein